MLTPVPSSAVIRPFSYGPMVFTGFVWNQGESNIWEPTVRDGQMGSLPLTLARAAGATPFDCRREGAARELRCELCHGC